MTMPDRQHTITAKIGTRFGSMYAHVSHVGKRITEVRFSAPGKFNDTTMGEVLDRLADTVTDMVAQIENADHVTEARTT